MSKQVQIKIHKADGSVEEHSVSTFTDLQKSINSDYLQQVLANKKTKSVFLVDEEILFKNNPETVAVNISEVAQSTLSGHRIFGDLIEISSKDLNSLPYS